MKVQILMSVYNGSVYLKRQLESIIAQDIGGISLMIRDDGSTDSTSAIISEYRQKYPWIAYYRGKNVGVQRSFFDLIKSSDQSADYTAFADQDDVWLPEKLSRAVLCLEAIGGRNDDLACNPGFKFYLDRGQSSDCEAHISVPVAPDPATPLLYCGAQQMVGSDLKPIRATVTRIVRRPDFGNALVQNICTGCTAVANRALMDLLRTYPPENIKNIIMHDWWLYLSASCFGRVFYDDVAYIRYRQHGKNVCSAILDRRTLLCYRLGQLRKSRGEIYRQVGEFLKTYREKLTCEELEDQLCMIQNLLSAQNTLRGRLKVACSGRYFRQKPTDDLIFRGIVLIRKL